jgi:hypothetical protein
VRNTWDAWANTGPRAAVSLSGSKVRIMAEKCVECSSDKEEKYTK